MTRPKAAGWTLPALLLVLSLLPMAVAALRLVQLPMGSLPEDESARFAATPLALWLHSLGGVLFGLLGPVQFSNVLRQRFGRAHRVAGRLFVLAGLALALPSFRLLWVFPEVSTPLLTLARGLAAAGLALCLVLGVDAARRGRFAFHRAWMIRAYALGMGAATVALFFVPLFALGIEVPPPLVSDLIFVASWVFNLALAEWVIRRGQASQAESPTEKARHSGRAFPNA